MQWSVASGQWPILGAGAIFSLETVLNVPAEVWERVKVDRFVPCGFLVEINSNDPGGFGIPWRAFRTLFSIPPPPWGPEESSR
jgi:hypothetical protein